MSGSVVERLRTSMKHHDRFSGRSCRGEFVIRCVDGQALLAAVEAAREIADWTPAVFCDDLDLRVEAVEDWEALVEALDALYAAEADE